MSSPTEDLHLRINALGAERTLQLLDAEQTRRTRIETQNELSLLYEPHGIIIEDSWEIATEDDTNHPPEISRINDRTYYTNDSDDSFNLQAIDPDSGDTQTWSKVSGPSWVSVSTAGLVEINPPNNINTGPGTYNVSVQVSDSHGAIDTADFAIIIRRTNRNPVLSAVTHGNITIGDTVTVELVATDLDEGDVITYLHNAGGGTLNPTSGLFTWTPTTTGTKTARFQARDSLGALSAERTLSFTVNAVVANVVKPIPERIRNRAVLENNTDRFTARATDPNNRALTWSRVSGVGSITAAGVYTYTAGSVSSDTVNKVKLRVTATGGGPNDYAEIEFNLTVNNNRAPTLSGIRNREVRRGETLTIDISNFANDPERNTITYSESGVGSINSSTGIYTYSPSAGTSLGNKTVIFTATATGGSASETIIITVQPAPVTAVTATASISPQTDFELPAVNPSRITVTLTSVSSTGDGDDIRNYKTSGDASWTSTTSIVRGANRIGSAIFAIPPQGQSYSCNFYAVEAGVRPLRRVSNIVTVTVTRLGSSYEPSITVTSQQLGYANPIRDRQSDVNGYIYYTASRYNGERFGWYSMDITMERKINNVWTDVTSTELNIPDDEFQNKRSSTFNVQVLINQLSLSGRFDYRIKLAYTDTVNNVAYTASTYTAEFSITWE